MKKGEQIMSEDEFETIAMIDYWYFAVRQFQEWFEQKRPKDPISRMVDDATGYGKKITIESAENVLHAMSEVLRLKKRLNEKYGHSHDLSHDENSLKGLTEFIERLTPPAKI